MKPTKREPLQPGETVLAIDPGNFQTAYALLSEGGNILGTAKVDNAIFLERFTNMLRMETPPTRIVTEVIQSYGMAVGASVFETCFFIGQLMQVCAYEHKSMDLVGRLQVKLAICRSPKANDSNIRTALIDIFGPPGKKSAPGPTYGITADRWAALALAETARRGEYAPYIFTHDRDPV